MDKTLEQTKVFLSKNEACAELGISLPTLNRRLKDRVIPSVKLGGRILIPARFITGLEKMTILQTPVNLISTAKTEA